MPTVNRIAKLGLRYSNWHTTALCSPTRSCFLTGRNAHMNGMACITEASTGFPGGNGVIPQERHFRRNTGGKRIQNICRGQMALEPDK
jgi:arylsulfatase